MARVLVAAGRDPAASSGGGSGGCPLGYIVGWLVAGELQVLELAVEPASQGRGIGRALLAALMRQARSEVGERVTVVLEVRSTNDRATRLYQRAGFRQVGLRPGYYANGDDAALLQATIE